MAKSKDKGRKAGDTVVDASGTTWRYTQGGHWRAENGDQKGNLYSGEGEPTSAPAATTVAASPYDADKTKQLDLARKNLQSQVDNNLITQAAADAEYNRLTTLSADELLRGNNQYSKDNPNYSATLGGKGLQAPTVDTNNPQDVARGQDFYNEKNLLQNLIANRPDEVNPYGSSRYQYDEKTGQIVRVSDLSAPEKAKYEGLNSLDQFKLNTANGLTSQISEALSKPLNYEGLPNAPTNETLSAGRQRVEDELFNSYRRRMDPLRTQEREALTQNLADRGIPFSSDPNSRYQQEMRSFEQKWNDAYSDANTQVIAQGGQEQQNQYNLGNQMRTDAYAERANTRANPLIDYSTLLGAGGGVSVNTPNFQAMTPVVGQATDLSSLASGYRGQDISLQQSQLGADAQLGAAGISADAAKLAAEKSAEASKYSADLNYKANQEALAAQQANNPTSSDVWGQIGGSVVGGLTQGLTSAYLSRSAKPQPQGTNTNSLGSQSVFGSTQNGTNGIFNSNRSSKGLF